MIYITCTYTMLVVVSRLLHLFIVLTVFIDYFYKYERNGDEFLKIKKC